MLIIRVTKLIIVLGSFFLPQSLHYYRYLLKIIYTPSICQLFSWNLKIWLRLLASCLIWTRSSRRRCECILQFRCILAGMPVPKRSSWARWFLRAVLLWSPPGTFIMIQTRGLTLGNSIRKGSPQKTSMQQLSDFFKRDSWALNFGRIV